jgi:hypothetical protein
VAAEVGGEVQEVVIVLRFEVVGSAAQERFRLARTTEALEDPRREEEASRQRWRGGSAFVVRARGLEVTHRTVELPAVRMDRGAGGVSIGEEAWIPGRRGEPKAFLELRLRGAGFARGPVGLDEGESREGERVVRPYGCRWRGSGGDQGQARPVEGERGISRELDLDPPDHLEGERRIAPPGELEEEGGRGLAAREWVEPGEEAGPGGRRFAGGGLELEDLSGKPVERREWEAVEILGPGEVRSGRMIQVTTE